MPIQISVYFGVPISLQVAARGVSCPKFLAMMAISTGNLYLSHSAVVANGADKQFNNQQARGLDSEFLEDHPKKRTMKAKGFELLEKHIKQSIAVSKVSKVEGSEIPW